MGSSAIHLSPSQFIFFTFLPLFFYFFSFFIFNGWNLKLLFATLNLNHPYQLHQVGIAPGLNPVCRILKSPSIDFNIQHHLLIPHCSYISQVVKRSTEWKPLAKSKVKAFLTAKMMQLLNQKPIHSNQLASFFIPYLSWQQQQQQNTHTQNLDTYAHPTLHASSSRSCRPTVFKWESIAIQPIWSSNLSCCSNPLPTYMSSCFFYIN